MEPQRPGRIAHVAFQALIAIRPALALPLALSLANLPRLRLLQLAGEIVAIALLSVALPVCIEATRSSAVAVGDTSELGEIRNVPCSAGQPVAVEEVSTTRRSWRPGVPETVSNLMI